MKLQLPSELVRRSLDAHSAMGLVIGALMYFICLTGTIVVAMQTFERWEQPAVPEFREVTVDAVEAAVAGFLDRVEKPTGSLWVVFPTADMPRMHVADEEQEWFTDAHGNLDAEPVHGWTHMLAELHVKLHLPGSIGLILVSAAGAILVALIISGILAHPRLFKDAFIMRWGGSRRLEQADLHNRLSVWALPFHLMIAITGAFFGLVGILVFSASSSLFEGDEHALFDTIFGADPVLDAQIQQPDMRRALENFRLEVPEAKVQYLVTHNLGERSQFMEIAATLPGRLAWSEIYRFDSAGNALGSQELTTGPAGRQVLYSIYRIHFGWFGGSLVRITWMLLGLAMTVIAASGINIWLARRAREDALARWWSAAVWGSPLALTLSALAAITTAISPLGVFLVSLGACWLWSHRQSDFRYCDLTLRRANGAALIALALVHSLVYMSSVPQWWWFNALLAIVGLGLLTLARPQPSFSGLAQGTES
jgi:uncharacterized iron-regulated membrane protein